MFNYKMTELSTFTSTVRMDDHKLLQESNLTARQVAYHVIHLK